MPRFVLLSESQKKELKWVSADQLAGDFFPFSKLPRGIPRSAITEWVSPGGCGKTEMALQFLAENPNLQVVWVEDQITFYPPVLSQYGISHERVLFLEGGQNSFWALTQALLSGLFQIAVVSSAFSRFFKSELETRRVQLLAEKTHAAVLVLSESLGEQASWAVTLQTQILRIGNDFKMEHVRGKKCVNA